VETPDSDIEQDWKVWKASGDPRKLRGIVNRLQPTITGVLSSAGIKNPIITDRARLVAAKAAQSYDPTKGAKLQTYVSSQLRSVVRDAPKIQEPMVPGQKYRAESAELHTAKLRFTDTFGRDATDEELSELTNIPLRKVVRLQSSNRARIPMSMVEEADDDINAPDVIGSTRTPYDDWVDAVYHGLGDVDRLVLMHKTGYRHAEPLDDEQLSKRVGLSVDAVQQRARRIQEQLDRFRTGAP
jgi:DNA-directed RNA polymerase specialized sigma subunit